MTQNLIAESTVNQWEAQAQHNINKNGFHTRIGYILLMQRRVALLSEACNNANADGNISLGDELEILEEIDKLIARCIEMRKYLQTEQAIQHETIVRRNNRNE